MSDELLAYSHRKMKEYAIVTGGDAATRGLLTMTDARWKQTIDFLRDAGLTKPGIDYAKAYTLSIVQGREGPALTARMAARRRAGRSRSPARARPIATGTQALAPVDLTRSPRRVRHAARTVGLRQDDAAQPDGGTARADRRRRCAGGAATSRRPAVPAGGSRWCSSRRR